MHIRHFTNEVLTMPQDRESGARADRWGRETAQNIAKQLGTKMMSGRNGVRSCI